MVDDSFRGKAKAKSDEGEGLLKKPTFLERRFLMRKKHRGGKKRHGGRRGSKREK